MTVLYLSPHADDAVFSAGGAIARDVAAGRRVVVATIFSAAAEHEEVRRDEDRAAMEVLGAELVALDFAEAPRRDRRYGRPGAMFAPIGDHESALVDEIARALRDLSDRVGATEVIAPLGVGEHADHQLAYAAAAQAFPSSAASCARAHYEDIPYALCRYSVGRRLARLGFASPTAPRAGALAEAWTLMRFWGSTPYIASAFSPLILPFALTALAWPMLRARPARISPSPVPALPGETSITTNAAWSEESIDISDFFDKKLAAVAAYRTQHPLFHPSLSAWRRALSEHARAFSPVVAERRWRPR